MGRIRKGRKRTNFLLASAKKRQQFTHRENFQTNGGLLYTHLTNELGLRMYYVLPPSQAIHDFGASKPPTNVFKQHNIRQYREFGAPKSWYILPGTYLIFFFEPSTVSKISSLGIWMKRRNRNEGISWYLLLGNSPKYDFFNIYFRLLNETIEPWDFGITWIAFTENEFVIILPYEHLPELQDLIYTSVCNEARQIKIIFMCLIKWGS